MTSAPDLNRRLAGIESLIAGYQQASNFDQLWFQEGQADPMVVTPAEVNALGMRMAAQNLTAAAVAGATWPTANMAYLYPFAMKAAFTPLKAFVENGNAVSGNFDVGVYEASSKYLVVSLGSTAQAGVTSLQVTSFANSSLLPPGKYFLALAFDNTTAKVVSQASGAIHCRAMGVFTMAAGFALPATAAFDATEQTFFAPVFGMAVTPDF